MRSRRSSRFACVLLVAAVGTWAGSAAEPRQGVDWPAFRGLNSAGNGDGASPPSRWDISKPEHVLFKKDLPGLGHSSPVIWGDRVYLTTAVSSKGDQSLRVGLYGDIAPVDEDFSFTWKVLCLNKRTGELLWERDCHEGVPRVKRHTKATHANSSAATDGQHVVAFFGSEGLHCFTVDGEPRWKKDFGVLDSGFHAIKTAQWGFASSPIIHDGLVIVQADVQQNSFIAAFDVRDGNEVWRRDRNDLPGWATPVVFKGDGAPQVIVNGCKHIGGYDLRTGEERWRMGGGGGIPVPTPIISEGLMIFTSNHSPQQPIFAVKPSATGDISLAAEQKSSEHVAWSTQRNGNYMQTPISYGPLVYFCKDNGLASAYDAATGEQKWRQRLTTGGTGFTPSPIAADGKLYWTSEDGDVYVVKAGPEFALVAENRVGDVCMATPAVSEGVIYFRTQKGLIAIVGEDGRR